MERQNPNLMNHDLIQYQFECVLTEYKALRDEIIKCSDRQVTLFYYLILVLTAFYGVIGTAIAAGKNLDFLLILIPFFATPFILRYSWEQYNTAIIGNYILEEIEAKRIPDLIGNRITINTEQFEKYWIGWQHYWMEKGWLPNVKYGFYEKHLAALMLFFISFIPAIFYSLFKIFQIEWSSFGLIELEYIFVLFVHCCLFLTILWSISKYERIAVKVKMKG